MRHIYRLVDLSIFGFSLGLMTIDIVRHLRSNQCHWFFSGLYFIYILELTDELAHITRYNFLITREFANLPLGNLSFYVIGGPLTNSEISYVNVFGIMFITQWHWRRKNFRSLYYKARPPPYRQQIRTIFQTPGERHNPLSICFTYL